MYTHAYICMEEGDRNGCISSHFITSLSYLQTYADVCRRVLTDGDACTICRRRQKPLHHHPLLPLGRRGTQFTCVTRTKVQILTHLPLGRRGTQFTCVTSTKVPILTHLVAQKEGGETCFPMAADPRPLTSYSDCKRGLNVRPQVPAAARTCLLSPVSLHQARL
jgi:hypothetical protein